MPASTTFSKVIDHRFDRFEGADAVGPEIGAVCLAGSRIEHGNGCFIGVKYPMPEHLILQRINQGLEGYPAFPHPLRQSGLRDRQTGPTEDSFLPIERQMIEVFGNQHLREQAAGWNALVDDVRRDRRLDQRFALSADPFATNVALDREDARCVVELLPTSSPIRFIVQPQGQTVDSGSC